MYFSLLQELSSLIRRTLLAVFDEDENKTNSVEWLSQSPDLHPFEHNLLYFSFFLCVQSTKQKK